MTKKDKINYLLMAPFLLTIIGGCIFTVVVLAMKLPLGLLVLAMLTTFTIGFMRFMAIDDD